MASKAFFIASLLIPTVLTTVNANPLLAKKNDVSSVATTTTTYVPSTTTSLATYESVTPCPIANNSIYVNELSGKEYTICCGVEILYDDLPSLTVATFADCIKACDAYVPAPKGDSGDSPCIGVSYDGLPNYGANCFPKSAINGAAYFDERLADSAVQIGYHCPVPTYATSSKTVTSTSLSSSLSQSSTSTTSTSSTISTSSLTSTSLSPSSSSIVLTTSTTSETPTSSISAYESSTTSSTSTSTTSFTSDSTISSAAASTTSSTFTSISSSTSNSITSSDTTSIDSSSSTSTYSAYSSTTSQVSSTSAAQTSTSIITPTSSTPYPTSSTTSSVVYTVTTSQSASSSFTSTTSSAPTTSSTPSTSGSTSGLSSSTTVQTSSTITYVSTTTSKTSSSVHPSTSSTSQTSSSSTYKTSTSSSLISTITLISSSTFKTSMTTSSTSKCTLAVPAPTCEYGIGKWCSAPLPPFVDSASCFKAASSCVLQIADCLLTSGSLSCISSFGQWCANVESYCHVCTGSSCSKSSCTSKYPPQGGPMTTTSGVGVCSTSTTSKPSTTTATSTSCIPPTATNVCILPTGSPGSGYSGGTCVGNIKPPILTCNNLLTEWAQNPFKLYTSKDSSSCPGYPRNSIPNACVEACTVQYNACINTYVPSCPRSSNGGGDSQSSATTKCKNQYAACKAANANVTPSSSRCGRWNEGWS